MRKKGQAWSLDLLIAVIIFSLIVLVIVTKLVLDKGGSAEELQERAKLASLIFFDPSSDLGFVRSGSVDVIKLNVLANNLNDPGFYEHTKVVMGLKGADYCIFFENQQGEIVLINNSLPGIGSSDLSIAGVECGTPMPPEE